MTVLITGASGKLGKDLSKLYQDALTPTHKELDIIKQTEVGYYIMRNKPSIIIHLAALTSPPKCKKYKELAWKTNVIGTLNLIKAFKLFDINCYFVLMSTPCIFNGDDSNPKNEYCYSDPDNYYGFTKAVQEMIVRSSSLNHLIIRGNFVPYQKYPFKKAFIDRKSNYLFTHQLAKGIKDVIDFKLKDIVHILGDKIISMYELAKRCPGSNNIEPYTLKEYYKDNPNSCKLTKNMILKSTRWKMYNIDEV